MAATFPPHVLARPLAEAIFALAVAGTLCATGCDKPKGQDQHAKPDQTKHGLSEEQAKLPLVVVGDTTVTVGQFAQQIAEKSPYLRARYASPERRRELLDELVRFELLAKEASKRGLDKSEEVERAKRQVMVQQMMKAEFEEKVKLSDVSDQEIEAYYNAHPEEFNKPAQVRASQIVVKDETKAKRALKLAQEATDEDAFRKLVAELSEDAETKERGGDLQFFSRPSERLPGDPKLDEAVAEAAFAIERVGEVFPQLVRSAQGFHIVRLTSKRKALTRTLDHARRPIQNKLWREKREAAVDSFMRGLRSKANVEENLALLDQLQIEAPDAGTPPRNRAAKAGTSTPHGAPK